MTTQQTEPASLSENNLEGATVQLVTFEVNQELYGIPVSSVEEVIEWTEITPAPGAIEMLEGLIDLRGDIIPVIDLRKRFNVAIKAEHSNARIVIVEVQGFIFALIVDKVNEVSTFSLADFLPPPLGTNQPGSEYTVGVIHQEERLLLYLDLGQVLDIKNLMQEIS